MRLESPLKIMEDHDNNFPRGSEGAEELKEIGRPLMKYVQ